MRIKSQTAAGVTETMTFTFQGGQNTHVCYIITPRVEHLVLVLSWCSHQNL